jgi:threonyl-tRNA synthetase
LGTIQVDFSLPERFKLEYKGSDGADHRPVMIHRAVFGSIERFMGLVIEHFAGDFPVWLAPAQVRILPITDEQIDYAKAVQTKLRAIGARVDIDTHPDKIGAKVRRGRLDKVPHLLTVGKQEEEGGTVSLRSREKENEGTVSVDDFVKRLDEEIRTRKLTTLREKAE